MAVPGIDPSIFSNLIKLLDWTRSALSILRKSFRVLLKTLIVFRETVELLNVERIKLIKGTESRTIEL